MTDTTRLTTATPWHLWVVGAVALLWNGYGGYDYVMTQTDNAAYLAQFTAEQRAYFDSFPMWMEAVWAIGVWGAVLGSILLLLRMRLAVQAFALSLLGAVLSLIYGLAIDKAPPPPPEMAVMAYMPWVIVVIAALLAWYAWAMSKRGVLR